MRGRDLLPSGLSLLCVAVIASMSFPRDLARAQEAKGEDAGVAGAPGLGTIKQAEAREKLQALEETMERLARLLAATEPDRALKLRAAFETSRKRLLREGMDRVVHFIEERKLYEAKETQDGLVRDLQELLDMLLERDVDPRELIRAVRELRDIVQDLDEVIREETAEKIASDDAEAARSVLPGLKDQKERLEDLIDAEKAIEKSLGAQPGEGSEGRGGGGKPGEKREPDARRKSELEGISKRQKEVEDRTAALRKDAAGGSSPGGTSGSQASPSSGQGAGEDGVDARKLGEAGEAMAGARKAMREGDPEAAAIQARKAREALESARGEAEEKLERLRRSRDFEKLERDQDSTRAKTDEIARRMRKTPPLTYSPEGGVPGRKDVEGASGSMDDASGSLSQGEAGEASSDQQEARQRLEKGREQAEETLAALQKALRDRILAYLRDRITYMLQKQIEISRDTKSLDARLRVLVVAAASKGEGGEVVDPEKGTIEAGIDEARLDPARMDRKDLQRAKRLSRREGALMVVAEDIIDLLDEDGTTLVFPRIIGQVRRDLETARDRLDGARTGEKTRAIQKDIESTLREILEAIKQAQRRPPPPSPDQGRESKNGTGPLLPRSSELKMVLSLQQRVNRRTELFDLDRGAEELDESEKEQARDIADNQGEIEDLLRKIARSLGER